MFINNYSVRYIDLNSEEHKTNNQDFVKLPSAFLPDIISKGQVRRMSSASRNAISMCHELWPLGNQYKPFSFHIGTGDRKSTRLNFSHVAISYAVFCLKKKNSQ